MIRIAIYSLVLMIVFTSCEKTIDINVESKATKLVVNSLISISPDSVVAVNVSKSLSILDNDNIVYINDATVNLYENGVFLQTLSFDNNGNYYAYQVTPDFGKNYSLKVSAPGYKDAYAENNIPMPIQIISVDTMTVSGEWNDMLQCKIKFYDNPDERNYYFFNVRSLNEKYDPDSTINYSLSNIYFDSTDPIVEETLKNNFGILFSDEMINGQTYSLSVLLNKYDFTGNDTIMVYFNLNSITYDFYLYAKSYANHVSAQGDPFAEPVQVYNNITGGYGVFAGFSSSVDSVAIVETER
jgi:hypothetical protein